MYLALAGAACDHEFRVRRGPAEDQARAVGLGQADLGDAAVGEVDDAPVEPACRVIGKIERAAGEPRLRVAGLSDVDAVIAGAEPIVTPLADDQPGEHRPGFVLEGDQGRFAFARIFDLETGVEIGLSRLGLDQSHVGHGQHDPANFARVGRIIAFLRDEPSVTVAHEGQVQARTLDRDRSDLAELVGQPGERGSVRPGAADAGAAGGERHDCHGHEHDGRGEQQDQTSFLHGTLSRIPGRLLLMPRPRDGGAA